MNIDDFYIRRAGVLLHPTSLPSGKLDGDVERWLDFLQRSGFQAWQMLPLGEPQFGLSPYQCVSVFALNPVLISDYAGININNPAYLHFYQHNQYWLDDYVLFKLIKTHQHQAPWYEWPANYKNRDSETLRLLQISCKPELDFICWQQYCLYSRWQQIKQNAAEKNILLFGDMPIFVAHDSVDVWICPQRYLLDENGRMTYITGVPPDYFSATGQCWGNPHYNWEMMHNENFRWWIQRLSYHFELFDLVRIDHFRGLESVWMINADADTAVDGFYQKVPGDELLDTIWHTTGQLPVVAEDLGIITKEVTTLRKKFHLPGMTVLQFGFDAHDDNPHKVKNIHPDSVVYTGTHDNDTTLGWFKCLDTETKRYVLDMLAINIHLQPETEQIQPETETGYNDDSESLEWLYSSYADSVVEQMMLSALHSAASLCIFPLQDCLHLDSQARMNTPGTIGNNWYWQFDWKQLDDDLSKRFRQWIQQSQRHATIPAENRPAG